MLGGLSLFLLPAFFLKKSTLKLNLSLIFHGFHHAVLSSSDPEHVLHFVKPYLFITTTDQISWMNPEMPIDVSNKD